MKKISYPFKKSEFSALRAGEEVFLSGSIYTARDQAHKRFVNLISQKKKLPFSFKGKIIYYCGPTPCSKDKIIGSCGPTTSSRMDDFTPALLDKGLLAMIGKGRRSLRVRQAIKKRGAVYFLAPAGCGALLSTKVRAREVVLFPDLGPEAVYRLEVVDFPLIVGIDSGGKSIYPDL